HDLPCGFQTGPSPFTSRDLVDRTPYTEHKVSRCTRFTLDAGEPVYELISPSGEAYLMQSYSEIVDPSLRMADLQNLGSRLKLPRGWIFRTRILAASLPVIATGEARIVQDATKNPYRLTPPNPKARSPLGPANKPVQRFAIAVDPDRWK